MNDTHLEEMLIINRLDLAVKNNDIEAVSQILKELLDHTSTHFFDEEDMMKDVGYPAYQTHKSEHDRHLKELAHLIKYFDERRDTKAIAAYVDGNLISWMIDHVQTMDTMAAMYLQEG